MKKIFAACLTFLALNGSAQLVLQNSGSIRVSSGTHVIVNGNLENQAGGDFINNGTLTLNGNFTNNQVMAEPGSGTLKFEGTSAQTLDGTEAVFAKDVVLNNPNGVTASTLLKVDGEFNFMDGIITSTNTSPILFTANGVVSATNPPSDASHVNGYVVKEGTGGFTYPVGDGTSYQPASTSLISNSDGMQVHYAAADAAAAAFGTAGSENTPLAIYNNKEYWDITPLGSAAGNVTLFWDAYNPLTFGNVADLRVGHKNSSWLNEGGSGSGTTSSGSITSGNLTTWSPFTLGSIYNPLPVTLISFKGEKEGPINLLYWQTSQEKNFSHFEVQHGRNGLLFTGVTAIKGNSNGNYHYTHTTPFPGINYYRLKMVDRDGTFAYSKIISLTNEGNRSVVYPNPASTLVTIHVDNTLLQSMANLYDVTGRLLKNVVIRTSPQQINVTSLSSGVYIMKFADGTSERFVKE